MKEFTKSRELLEQISSAGQKAGFRRRLLGEISLTGETIPILALSKRKGMKAPRILISAGLHGDEPAGPHAILALLQEIATEWPELSSCHVEILPLINPTGFDRRQRENWQGIDLNRTFGSSSPPPEIRALMDDYRRRTVDLAVDLHEDVDTPGFYLYELSPSLDRSLGRAIINSLKDQGLPVNTSAIIEGLPASDGLILRTTRSIPRFFRNGAPQGLYMKKLGTTRTLTLETPPSLPLADRVSMHLVALKTILKSWPYSG